MSSEQTTLDLRDRIRDVPDFPKPGIMFKDVMPLVADPAYFRETIDRLEEHARGRSGPTSSSAPRRAASSSAARSRTGSTAASSPARKPGKLPWQTVEVVYALEYGTDSLQVHADAIGQGARVIVHDDVLATGGTAKAKVDLVEQLGGEVVGLLFVIELTFLNGRDRLEGYDVHSLIAY